MYLNKPGERDDINNYYYYEELVEISAFAEIGYRRLKREILCYMLDFRAIHRRSVLLNDETLSEDDIMDHLVIIGV